MNLVFLMFVEVCKLHWVASKVYMNSFGVHSLCTRSSVVCTSINFRKMKFIPLIISLHWSVNQLIAVSLKSWTWLSQFLRVFLPTLSEFISQVSGFEAALYSDISLECRRWNTFKILPVSSIHLHDFMIVMTYFILVTSYCYTCFPKTHNFRLRSSFSAQIIIWLTLLYICIDVNTLKQVISQTD